MKKIFCLIAIAGFLFCFNCILARAENVGFVVREDSGLMLNGQPYYFASSNNYSLFYETQAVVNEVLTDVSALGLEVMRTWGSCEGAGPMGYSFQPEPGVYSEATFLKMDYIIWKANQMNIRLIIPMVNNWDDNFGGIDQYVEWSPTANTHDQFFTDVWCRNAYKAYINYFLNRVNTLTGVAYKNDPTIMVIELANEARCGSDPSGDNFQAWVEEMSAYVKSIDTNHLVSTGSEGWFADDPIKDPVTWTGVDFIRNNQTPDIDICSMHLFSDAYGLNNAGTDSFIVSHISAAQNIINKPIYLGEFGQKANRQAVPMQSAQTLHDFITDTEGWFSVGSGFSNPIRVAQPSYNNNGSLDFLTNGNIGPGNPNSSGQGEKQYAMPYLNCSGYGDISAWVYIPATAPDTMRADMYLYTGGNWQWYDGLDKPLVPGQWNQISISTENVANLNSVRAMGIRTFSFDDAYNGNIYYDLVEGVIGNLLSYPAQLANRNSYYSNVYNLMNTSGANGAGFWVLLPEGYVDADDYGVYYPQDTSTVPIIQNFSAQMEEKSGPSYLWDDCEIIGNWYPNTITSDALSVTLNSQFITQGQHSLKLTYAINGFDKAFIENAGPSQGGLNENWATRDNLAFDLYNPGGPTTADVGLSTGVNWVWHESYPQNLTTGWNHIIVDLTSSNWKTAASGWQYTASVADLNQVKRLSIGVFGYTSAGSFYIDNIRLDVPAITIDEPDEGEVVTTLTPEITWHTGGMTTNENVIINIKHPNVCRALSKNLKAKDILLAVINFFDLKPAYAHTAPLWIEDLNISVPNTGSYSVQANVLAFGFNYTLKISKASNQQISDTAHFSTQALSIQRQSGSSN